MTRTRRGRGAKGSGSADRGASTRAPPTLSLEEAAVLLGTTSAWLLETIEAAGLDTSAGHAMRFEAKDLERFRAEQSSINTKSREVLAAVRSEVD